MEVALLANTGIPEDAILSVRAGTVRRQAVISSGRPFRFPKIGPEENPLKIDVLQQIATTYLVMKPDEEQYKVTFNGGELAAGMTAEVAIMRTDGSTSAPAEEAPAKGEDAERDAKDYLESHQILQFVQALLQTLIKERPADPYAYMARHFMSGYEPLDTKAPKPAAQEGALQIPASPMAPALGETASPAAERAAAAPAMEAVAAAVAEEAAPPAEVPAAVPLKDAVVQGMAAFEGLYNADNTPGAAAGYAAECDVTVNGGDVFSGQSPEMVAGFLNTLRNVLGGTGIKFVVTKIDEDTQTHEDVWVADNGAGKCVARWGLVDGEWKILADAISFTPKAAETEDENAGGVPVATVMSTMKAFEDHYNAEEMDSAAEAYASECDVTVNGGDTWAGSTREGVRDFLLSLRNEIKATNIKFAVTSVAGNVHEDVWVSDAGAGSCRATWEQEEGSGAWKIVKDEISFTPKV